MIQRVLRYVMLGAAVVVLTACGGGGSNESNIKEGFFSKVVGLSYETSSGQKGVTDERGAFKYKEGDSITFSLNEVTIGTTDAKETISVFDFKNATVISQFLDSLDSNKDLSNGIDLSYFADSISSVRQTKMYKPSSLLEATVQDDRIQFNLEKVTAYDKRYIDFLKRNNANIFPGVKSTTEKFMQEVESKIQIPQTDVYANSAKGIVIGKNIPMKAYFRDRPNIQETVEALYSSKKYDYRIMLAALNRIYNQGLYELAERNANVLENAEDRKKITDDMITKVGVGFDVTYQVMDATLDGDFKALAASKTYADYQVDTSTLPDGYKPALKLATTVTYDCLTARDKKSCMLNSAANGIALYSETVLSEDYPVLAATLSDGSGTAAGIVNMWIDCSKVESSFNNAKACVQDMFKEGTINSLKLTTTIAQIGLLTTDAKKVNNAKVALEAFVVKHLVAENDTCQAVGYYDQDKQEECEKETDESEKLERLFEAIQKAEILDIQDVIGLNVSDSDVLVEYEKLEKKYPKIKDIYSKAFAQYAKQDGTIDETKIEEALKSYVDFKIDTVSPSVEANSNGSYKLNITTCMQLESDIVLSNEVFVLKLIDEFQTVQYFELDPYTTISRGTKKVCGVLQNVQLNGSSNFITGTKVHPFLIDAKFSYSIQNSLDGFTHELTDRVLNEGRLIQGDKSSVQIVDAYKGDKTYHLHATVPNDIRANASGKYSYHWVLETPGCSKVEYDGVELDYKVCNDRIALAKVSVFDAVTNEFVVTESKSLQPGLTLIPQGENSFEVSGSEFVYTKNGESSTYNFTVLGRDNYSVSFSMDDGLTKSASTPNSVTIVAKNTTSETIERVLTISVTSNKETVSKKVIFKIQPSSTPVVSRETISYKKSLETYPQANPGETIVKKWGLLNISDHTIKQVYLQWNPQKSYSGLIHQKRIDLGDVRPFDLSLNQSLQIVIPEALQGTHHFGYFDVYYTKEDGTTEKLLYSDGREASVIYNIDVEKKDTVPAVVPIIENTSIYAIDHIVYGTFEVLQNDNKQIKHLRVHFSTDTYFRENNSYVDVGGDYESLQDDGFKSFQFDASLYA